MQLFLKLRDYMDAMHGSKHLPLDLSLILEPFGISYNGEPDDCINIGMFLPVLTIDFNEDDWIDPIDVAQSAASLGYSPAEVFIERAPSLMTHAVKKGFATFRFSS